MVAELREVVMSAVTRMRYFPAIGAVNMPVVPLKCPVLCWPTPVIVYGFKMVVDPLGMLTLPPLLRLA